MLKKWIKKLLFREKSSPEAYVKWLRKQGVRFGENSIIIDVRNFSVDVTRPYLVSIGDDAAISDHVTILTHDYSWLIIARAYPGELHPTCGPVTIGNNVFIGSHTTILQNVTIGDNVIIGANSLVTKDIPDGAVAAGIPAKIVTSVEELGDKRAKEELSALKQMLLRYREVYGRDADDYALREHLAFYKSVDEIRKENPQYVKDYFLDEVERDLRVAHGREALIEMLLGDSDPSK